jgi:hypothetical protein
VASDAERRLELAEQDADTASALIDVFGSQVAELTAQLACIRETIGAAISDEAYMPSSERLALMLHPLRAQWEKYLPDSKR